LKEVSMRTLMEKDPNTLTGSIKWAIGNVTASSQVKQNGTWVPKATAAPLVDAPALLKGAS